MATWTATKTMITNKGLLMISETQAGRGNITITRAVIGTTFSQTAQLPDMLAIPSPASLAPTINEVNTGTDGSRLTLAMSNKNLTTGFNIAQVGIYATHPNVDAGVERLYFITQSESPAEFFPSNAENIIDMSFDLYLRHDKIANPIINVVENYLPTASAQVLGAVKIGAGLTVTEEGVLSTQVINIASTENAGIVKVGDNLTIEPDGTLNAKESVSIITAPTKPALLANQYWFETLS